MTEIYEQILDGEVRETNVAYTAFCLYRDAGLSRSYIRVAEKVGKSYTLIRRWAKRHDWENRAKAYDRWAEGLEFEQRKKEIHETRLKHINLSRAAQGIVASWMNEQNELIKKGKKIRLTPSEAARLLDLSVKIESVAMGIPTEVTEQQMVTPTSGLGYIEMRMSKRDDDGEND